MSDEHRVREHLEVAGIKTINGLLMAGATVRAGAQLTVNGAVDGRLRVEPGGGLQVNGALNCDPESVVLGVLSVAGVINGGVTASIRETGHLVIAVGTIVNDSSGPHAVQADGSLSDVPQHIEKLTIDGGRTVTFERVGDGLSPISGPATA
jgi:hypothetical protein